MTTQLSTLYLGKTGLSVSEIALGTWRFGHENDIGETQVNQDRASALLDRYASYGGNFIDTANVYGGGLSESYIGSWLNERDRSKYVLASKIYWPTGADPNASGLHRRNIRDQIEAILRRLKTTYLDILYVHRWDEHTAVESVMRSLSGLVDDGKVDHLGTSTSLPDAWRVARANEYAQTAGLEPFRVAQPQYNLVTRQVENNYLPMCKAYDLAVVPWSPLAGGFLTGKYTRADPIPSGSRAAGDEYFSDRYLTQKNFDVLEVVENISNETGYSILNLSLGWLLQQEQVVSPIIGPRTPQQLDQDIECVNLNLTENHLAKLNAASSGH